MATNLLIALALAFGSAIIILLVVGVVLKLARPNAFKEMIPIPDRPFETEKAKFASQINASSDKATDQDPIDPVEKNTQPFNSPDLPVNFQMHILELLQNGCSVSEISQKLGISPHMVGKYMLWRVHLREQKSPGRVTQPVPEQPPLEKKVAEHDRAIGQLEKRMRQLEVESVQSIQEPQGSDAPHQGSPETVN